MWTIHADRGILCLMLISYIFINSKVSSFFGEGWEFWWGSHGDLLYLTTEQAGKPLVWSFPSWPEEENFIQSLVCVFHSSTLVMGSTPEMKLLIFST